MKKTLLAAALALGFAGVAQAETSVTLYGILDGGIGYQKYDSDSARGDRSKFGMIQGIQSGNRWGLKGTEDLGNGLRAVFQAESGFNLGTGNHEQGDRLFGRHLTLGLASDAWGQLDFGRQTNIASKYFGAIDPFGMGFNQANIGAAFSAMNTNRYDNMVMYQTPNFSGFQFGVGYSFNANGNQNWDYDEPVLNRGTLRRDGTTDIASSTGNLDDLNLKAITTGLRYANGPLAVALSYDRMEAPVVRGVVGETDDMQAYSLGLAYDFEVVKLHLAAGQTKDGVFAQQSFGDVTATPYVLERGLKINSYMVGLSAPLGAGKVMASWHMADPTDSPDGETVEWEKQNTFSIGYTYNLSKRTNVYAIGSYTKDATFVDGDKSTLLGIGLRHQF